MMIEYFNNNIYSFWFVIGFILLAVELLAFGFSTGFVLFVGLAALVTGGAVWFGLIPATWSASIATFAISSVVVSALLWKPLKAIQNSSKIPAKDNSSDLVGMKFRLDDDVSISKPGKTRYSGVEWQVEIALDSDVKEISAGTTVVVVSVEVGKFKVIKLAVE